MGKHFKTNDFSSAILESWEEFVVTNIKECELTKEPQLMFDWIFKKYNGVGNIDYDDAFKLRNEFGDNYSHLALSMECRDKHPTLKPTDSLYNDSNLAIIFQRILDSYFNMS